MYTSKPLFTGSRRGDTPEIRKDPPIREITQVKKVKTPKPIKIAKTPTQAPKIITKPEKLPQATRIYAKKTYVLN